MIRKYLVQPPRLYCGDCLVVMPEQVADHSVDLVLADLPYGTTQCAWDTIIPLKPLWAEYRRVLKPGGAVVLTASQPFASALVMSNPTWFRCEWVWVKNIATGHLNARVRPLLNHEVVLVFALGRYTYNAQGVRATGRMNRRGAGLESYGVHGLINKATGCDYPRTVIRFSVHRSKAQHPNQKPVALMEYLIRTYTHEGATVLDNTMGSGTTGVACVRTKRNFIGIEQDEEFFATARARIETVIRTGLEMKPQKKTTGGFFL